MTNFFYVVPNFLRDPKSFFESVRRGEGLKAKVMQLGLSGLVSLAVFGFVLGLSDDWRQALSSAVKMPLLFAATGLFCLPALYFFSLALLGTPLRMIQVTAIVLSGFGVTAFLLLGLAPVTLFFDLTTQNYGFFQVLAVGFVALSGLIGLYFLWNGMTYIEPNREGVLKSMGRLILAGWLVLYAFVSAQLTWRLSPFVGDPAAPFVLVQPSRDNFYIDVLHAFERALGITNPASSGAWLVGAAFGMLCFGLLLAAVISVGINIGRSRRTRRATPQEI
jgi:hypothetical protein